MNFLKNSLIFGISISLVNKYVFSVLFYYNIQGYLAGQDIGFDFWISVAVLFLAASVFFFVFDIFFHNKFLYQYLISILLCFLSFHIFLDISNIPEWRHLRLTFFGLTNNKYLILGWYIIPVVFFSFTSFFLKKKIKEINKFLVILSWCFFALFLYRIITAVPPNINLENLENDSKKISDKKVVWVLFDEFDYNFYKNNALSNLKNFNKFSSESLEISNMQATSDATITAIPEILTGIRSKNYLTTDKFAELYIVDENDNKIKFNFENSIFGKIFNKGFTSNIFGIYHPYCHIFYQIKNCSNIEFHHDKVKWYDGIKHILFLKLIDKFSNNKLGIISDITKKQIDLIPHHIESEDNLIFMHFGFPHLPSLYAEKIYNQKSNNEEDGYKLNLKLANDVLGIINKTLKKNQYENVLIILSSDHWLRSLKGPRPVLFNAKLINDSESFVLNNKLSNYYISELVMKYFDNEINSNRDIKKFFQNKAAIPTRFTPKFSM